MDCLDEIISEAKCCAGKLAHDYARAATFGNTDDELSFNFMRLNAYIRTLERNKTKHSHKKEIVYENPKTVSLNSLQKKNNLLYLKQKQERKVITRCEEITPCLTDDEIRSIVEEIKLLCSNCSCNCN